MERVGDNLKPLVDTHAIYWYFFDRKKLPLLVVDILDSKKFIVSTIILAELANLLERKRKSVKEQQEIWQFLKNKNTKIASFDDRVFKEFLHQDKNLDIHDRIIVATAKTLKAHLITKDRLINKYYKKVIW